MALTKQDPKTAALKRNDAKTSAPVGHERLEKLANGHRTHRDSQDHSQTKQANGQQQQQQQQQRAREAKMGADKHRGDQRDGLIESLMAKEQRGQTGRVHVAPAEGDRLAERAHQPRVSAAGEQTQQAEKGQQQQQQQQQQPQPQQQPQARQDSLPKRLLIDALLALVKVLIFVYDLISQPIFYYKYKVYERQHQVDQLVRCRQMDPADPSSAWRQEETDERQREIERNIDAADTYDQLMASSFKRYAHRPCYAYRQVLRETWTRRPESDKLFRQVELSDYKWVTFGQFERQIECARKGFLLAGVRAADKVMLYADTRPEWQIASQALVRLGAVVGTMYSTLGTEGIVHSVNETQVSHVVAQKDKVGRLLRLKDKLPRLAKIIYLESSFSPDELADELADGRDERDERDERADGRDGQPGPAADFEHPQVECLRFRDMMRMGARADERTVRQLQAASQLGQPKRTKDSIAVIMYTSGSTGIPKGVLISHGNIMATIKSFSWVTKDFIHKPAENICAAYLPLAHIFEFCIESTMLYHGVRFGFATPHTLTDKSPGLLAGQLGDLSRLQPTVLIIVPLILDRIVQGVKQTLRQQSYLKEQLVSYLIRYKIHWQRRHYPTPLVDRIVCSKIAVALGGRAKHVICGSAPLSPETQTYVRAALNLRLPQGFGTTETCSATSCQLFDDQSTGNVGLPESGCYVKLEPWLEGSYRPTDRPNPRGEIVVGGQMIAHGYFNLDEQTRESFYVDQRGVRWYRTGDIGEILPNGNLKIIDRKKDLVKLQNGEYISLGKVESTLKSNPYLDNFCVYANSNYNYVVALGPANELAVKNLAQQVLDDWAGRSSPGAQARNDERRALLALSQAQQEEALEEIRQVLASYESDRANNNNNSGNPSANQNGQVSEEELMKQRKMSSLSTNSQLNANCINERLQLLCQNKLILERLLVYFNQLARERNLLSLEVPKKLLLLAEEWTEDKNLVTAAMKIRRNYIYKRYEKELEQLYAL